jgi:hypothetical protein
VTANDSPGDTLVPSTGEMWDARSTQFQMYFMWKYKGNEGFTGSIWVPLRVTVWSVSWYVELNADGSWNLISPYYTPNPASQETMDYPEWSSNITQWHPVVIA